MEGHLLWQTGDSKKTYEERWFKLVPAERQIYGYLNQHSKNPFGSLSLESASIVVGDSEGAERAWTICAGKEKWHFVGKGDEERRWVSELEKVTIDTENACFRIFVFDEESEQKVPIEEREEEEKEEEVEWQREYSPQLACSVPIEVPKLSKTWHVGPSLLLEAWDEGGPESPMKFQKPHEVSKKMFQEMHGECEMSCTLPKSYYRWYA